MFCNALEIRSEFFKTALSQQKKVFEVKECSQLVLETVLNFMYGANIPNGLTLEDAKSLLAMADLFKMDDLKSVVALLIGKQLNMNNIQEISELAEKHRALKLKQLCCDFILTDIDKLDTTKMDGSFPVLTVLGKAYLDKNKRCLALASKLLGVNVTEMGCFKKLNDFKSSEDYKACVKANIKDNMLVICNQDIKSHYYNVPKGSFGRVTRADYYSEATVKWQFQRGDNQAFTTEVTTAYSNLELLSPPLLCLKILF